MPIRSRNVEKYHTPDLDGIYERCRCFMSRVSKERVGVKATLVGIVLRCQPGRPAFSVFGLWLAKEIPNVLDSNANHTKISTGGKYNNLTWFRVSYSQVIGFRLLTTKTGYQKA